ncbi:MAG: hypothetical protein GF355_09635 [Candidatus Eisenbacteria bacterium]|nr:hypothetical protein [Candidatus Eisenbacteria bacterium]
MPGLIEQLQSHFPLAFFSPHRGQEPFHDSPARIRYFSGGNQAGKTTSLCAEAIAHMLTYRPWLPEGHPNREIKIPKNNTGRLACQDYKTSLVETLLPKLQDLAPRGFLTFTKDQQGIPSTIKGANGSVCYVLSYSSDPQKFESGTFHWAGFDEPPPRWAYTGTLRGLIRHRGRLWIAGTALTEPWLFDDVYLKARKVFRSGEIIEERPEANPEIEVFIVDIEDNLAENGGGLSREAVDQFVEGLDAAEVQIRARGLFPQVAGRVFKEWVDLPPFVIDPYEITHRGWGLYMAIDPHPKKPTCVEWDWLSPENNAINVGELYNPDLDTIPLVCERIHEWEKGFDATPVVRWMDGKMGKQKDQSSGLTIHQSYAENGVVCRLSTVPPEARLLRLKEWLRPVDGVPRLQVFRNCFRTREELKNARWPEWSRRISHLKAPKETIDPRWDDAIACHGYILSGSPTGVPITTQRSKAERPQDELDGSYTGY